MQCYLSSYATVRGVTKYSTIDVYNDTSGVWANTSSGAGALSVGRDFLAGAGSNGLIIFAGGVYAIAFNTCISANFHSVVTMAVRNRPR